MCKKKVLSFKHFKITGEEEHKSNHLNDWKIVELGRFSIPLEIIIRQGCLIPNFVLIQNLFAYPIL